MTLNDYLLQTYPSISTSQADKIFAEKVMATRPTVYRWRHFLRHPSPVMIARIRKETRGLVTAEDHLAPEYRETERERRARA